MSDTQGPSLDPAYRRARTDDQKRERGAAILLAARQEFEQRGFYGFTMRAVGERVHVSKAALYGYHASKHAILATLTSGMLTSWAEALAASLAGRGQLTSAQVTATVHESLVGRETLLDLLHVFEPSVAPGLTVAERASYDTRTADAMLTAGIALEAALGTGPQVSGQAAAAHVLAIAGTRKQVGEGIGALIRGLTRA